MRPGILFILSFVVLAACTNEVDEDAIIWQEYVTNATVINEEYRTALVKALNDPLLSLDNDCYEYDEQCIEEMLARNYPLVKILRYDNASCLKYVVEHPYYPNETGWCDRYLKTKMLPDYGKITVMFSTYRMRNLHLEMTEEEYAKDRKSGERLLITENVNLAINPMLAGTILSSANLGSNIGIPLVTDPPEDGYLEKSTAFFSAVEQINENAGKCSSQKRDLFEDTFTVAFYERYRQRLVNESTDASPLLKNAYLRHSWIIDSGIKTILDNAAAVDMMLVNETTITRSEKDEMIETLYAAAVLGSSGAEQQRFLIFSQEHRKLLSCARLKDFDQIKMTASTAPLYAKASAECGIYLDNAQYQIILDTWNENGLDLQIGDLPSIMSVVRLRDGLAEGRDFYCNDTEMRSQTERLKYMILENKEAKVRFIKRNVQFRD